MLNVCIIPKTGRATFIVNYDHISKKYIDFPRKQDGHQLPRILYRYAKFQLQPVVCPERLRYRSTKKRRL